jgi:hypothetical protein
MKRCTMGGFVFFIAVSVPLGALAASQTGGVPSLADRVTTLEDSVTTLQTTLTTLQTSLTTLQTTVVNVQSDNTTLQNALNAETQARKDADAALQSLIAAGLGGDVYSNSNLNLRSLSPTLTTPLATLQLPAGSYLVFGQALLSVLADDNTTLCVLENNGDLITFTELQISPIYENILEVLKGANAVLGGVTTTASIQSRFTLAAPAVISLACADFSGGEVISADLDAIRVEQIHQQ